MEDHVNQNVQTVWMVIYCTKQSVCQVNTSFSVSCNHGFSYKVFIKSITSKKYISKKCNFALTDIRKKKCSSGIKIIMGENNNGTDISGVFYGYTDKEADPL